MNEQPGGRSVIELLERCAYADAAVRFMPSGVATTMAQIWRDSERVARWLVARVGHGAAVGAFLSNTPDCPAVVLGIWRSGNTLVSLPYPSRGADLAGYAAKVGRMCELAQVELVLVDAGYQALLGGFPVGTATFQDASLGGPRCDAERSGGLIQFTSGSIGDPKGVVLSDRAIGANVLSILEAVVTSGDIACSWLPLSHDMGFVGMFLTALAGGAPEYGGRMLVLQTPESFLADPSSWLRTLSDVGATITTAPNFAFELACRSRPLLPGIDLSRLRVCITGAERVMGDTLARFGSTFADAGLSPTALCPAYGMAEATLAVSMVRPSERWQQVRVDRRALGEGAVVPVADDAAATDAPVVYVGNGRPVRDMEVRIAAASGRDVGEVQVRGPSMLSGYVGADLTTTADGWFATRDLGFLANGELFLVGRSDETIIVGGQNHYAGDIEAALSHDLVRSGCLAAVPFDRGYGIVAEPSRPVEVEALERACRELAVTATRRAGVRPSLVAFLPRGRLPKTPSGKMQRLQLRAALERGELELTTSISLEGSTP